MKIVKSLSFYFFIGLISLMPFFVMYALSEVIRVLLAYGISYRKKVVIHNLNLVFPELDAGGQKRLMAKIYRNLSDILLEGLKTFTLSKKAIVKRHRLMNAEVIEALKQKGKSVMVITGHYNNWEWGSLSAGLQTSYNIMAFYKPIANKTIDNYIKRSRSRCGTELVSIYHTSEAFENKKSSPTLYLMAADQSPSNRQLKYARWLPFLGQNTPFLHGIEKHARNYNHAVVYVDIQRVKRGYYQMELSLLSENPKSLEEGELTRLYVSKLEEVIRKKPENWLWTHKRWKHLKG